MKLFEITKTPGERQKRVSLSVFTTEWPALSDGQTKLYMDYHVIDKHEVTSLCGVPREEKKKKMEGERKTGMFINHYYCHLNLCLHLSRTSRPLIWNNKQ